ncbi:DUF4350 domain-containing protein [Intrasporangium sp. DVR]|uniref:DUF4350 domain-containing protein n=1 Tax=Intrasporangium sp. DVR TaxID=3127867 RepID=UPI00313A6FD7
MTTQLPASVKASAPASRRAPRRRWGLAALLAVAAIVGVALLALVSSEPGGSGTLADPAGSSRHGSRALAQVLREQGVEVQVVRTIRAFEAASTGPGTTVLVGSFDFLGAAAAERAARHAATARRLVLVEPSDLALGDLGVRLVTSGRGLADLRGQCTSGIVDPDDRLEAVTSFYRSAGSLGGDGPAMPDAATGCFRAEDDAAALVVLPATASMPETVVLGSAEAMTNARVSDASHAAIALRALGGTERLVWYVPDISDLDVPDASGQFRPSDRGVPEWFEPTVLLLVLTFVAFALARGRRLGRIVTEPLPVVVRAVETTEARGRLYRRAGDRPRAASILRAGTRSRVAARLGLPTPASDDAVVEAVARAADRDPAEVRALLHGPAPGNDRDLVLLAEQLAQLEENVRRA